jgi:DNA repair protein RadC
MQLNTTPNSPPIKEWAEADRPREKMMEKGARALTDVELIALLLGSGTTGRNAIEVARDLLRRVDNSLENLSAYTLAQLCQVQGIGPARAIRLMAALELSVRQKATTGSSNTAITCSRDAYEVLESRLSNLPTEEFWILILNQAKRVKACVQIGKGGISAVMVDARVIFKHALDHMGSSIILAHNHPSGNLTPSSEDLNLTRHLISGAELLKLKLIDHLIIGKNEYLSMCDEGLL